MIGLVIFTLVLAAGGGPNKHATGFVSVTSPERYYTSHKDLSAPILLNYIQYLSNGHADSKISINRSTGIIPELLILIKQASFT